MTLAPRSANALVIRPAPQPISNSTPAGTATPTIRKSTSTSRFPESKNSAVWLWKPVAVYQAALLAAAVSQNCFGAAFFIIAH
jgi:hypothetical protein